MGMPLDRMFRTSCLSFLCAVPIFGLAAEQGVVALLEIVCLSPHQPCVRQVRIRGKRLIEGRDGFLMAAKRKRECATAEPGLGECGIRGNGAAERGCRFRMAS